jgi:hypothetical protein
VSRLFRHEDRLQLLIERIDSTSDEAARRIAIEELSRIPGNDSPRVLMDSFRSCLWRETKIAIIRALGNTASLRTFEFLCEIAANTDDLPLSAESLLALGSSGMTLSCVYLNRVARHTGHPLQKEAIIALAMNSLFDAEAELLQILASATEVSPTVVQYAVLACARRHSSKSLTYIRSFLESREFESSGPIFNACVLALGMLGTKDDVAILRRLNTRYRFFADQLVNLAIQQIEERSSQRLRDLVTLFLAADSQDSRVDYALALQSADYEHISKEVSAAGGELTPDLEILLLMTRMGDPKVRQRFLSLIPVLPVHKLTATAAWNFTISASANELSELNHLLRTAKPGLLEMLPLEATVRDFDSLTSNSSADLQITLINAAAVQCQLSDLNSARQSVVQSLLKIAREVDAEPVRLRAIRALGQLKADKPGIVADLVNMLRDTPGSYSSVYYALGAIGGEEANRYLQKRLKQLIANQSFQGEFSACLRAICDSKSLLEADIFARLPDEVRKENEKQILRILTQQKLSDMQNLITEALSSKDHQKRLMGIAAAAVSQADNLLETVLEMVDSPNQAIAGRALHAVCIGASVEIQHKLLERLFAQDRRSPLLERCLQMLTIQSSGDYAPLVTLIDKWIKQQTAAGRRDSLSSAIDLRDNIQLKLTASTTEVDSKPLDSGFQHSIDESLKSQLVRFDHLSETVKSVLRNAELTFGNPELFNERVDKSTVIVEFVKSIDLFLQEKLSTSLFLNPARESFTKLQSRVMYLQLDDETITTSKRIRDLQCTGHFDVDTFPHHKLLSLARLVSTGRILHDQYRAIDGLRAWALMLLVFGREYSYQNQMLPAILPIRDCRNRNICEIAAVLNRLQEVRNLAAHRGTMLQLSSLGEVRAESLRILNRLIETI